MVYFIKNNNLGDFKNKDNMNLSIPKSFKYDYFLVKGSWELFKNSNELHLGNKYFLIQSVLENDKCFLGLFFLTKIYNNNLIFKSDKSKYQSKMFKYANINSLNIITYIYAQNEINILTIIQN